MLADDLECRFVEDTGNPLAAEALWTLVRSAPALLCPPNLLDELHLRDEPTMRPEELDALETVGRLSAMLGAYEAKGPAEDWRRLLELILAIVEHLLRVDHPGTICECFEMLSAGAELISTSEELL